MPHNYDHTHKYERVRLGASGYIVFKCTVPDCPHFINKKLVVGKKTICWRCGHEAVMTKQMAEFKKPHCRQCTDTTGGRGANRRGQAA